MTEAVNVVSFLFLGFFLGMRHATDADHVVAIATIVSRQRSLVRRSVISARSDQFCSGSVRDATNPRQSRQILC